MTVISLGVHIVVPCGSVLCFEGRNRSGESGVWTARFLVFPSRLIAPFGQRAYKLVSFCVTRLLLLQHPTTSVPGTYDRYFLQTSHYPELIEMEGSQGLDLPLYFS